MNKETIAEKFFLEGFACSQSVLMAYAEESGIDLLTAKKVASTFGAGMGRLRMTCGALTGAFMVIGLKYGNIIPDDMETKLHSYSIVQEHAKRFKQKHGTTDCSELLAKYTDSTSVIERKHHRIICNKLVKDSVRILEEILEERPFSRYQ